MFLGLMETDNVFQTVLLIIILCGIFGGLGNFVKNHSKANLAWFVLARSIVTGVIAAGIIPLFLHLLSSDLLVNLSNDDPPTTNYLVFAGFCLIAAFFSTEFLQSVAYRAIQDLKRERDAVKPTIDALVEANSSHSVQSPIPTNKRTELDALFSKIPAVKPIFSSLKSQTGTFVRKEDLLKPLGLDEKEFRSQVKTMIKAQLITEYGMDDGEKRYTLTDIGRRYNP